MPGVAASGATPPAGLSVRGHYVVWPQLGSLYESNKRLVGTADESTRSKEAARDQAVLGRALRALRKRSGMTQEELAAKAGTMGYYISLIENGHRGLRWHMVMRLLRAMDIGPAEFGAEVERHQSSH